MVLKVLLSHRCTFTLSLHLLVFTVSMACLSRTLVAYQTANRSKGSTDGQLDRFAGITCKCLLQVYCKGN